MTAMMSNEGKPERAQRKKTIVIVTVVLAFIILFSLLISSLFVALRLGNILQAGKNRLIKDRAYHAITLPDGGDEDAEYVYNKNVISILLIGVDKASNIKSSTATEQADALYLFTLDIEKKTAKVIAISRNTMMDVDIYDMNHNLIARDEQQICTAYAFGQTRQESAELTVNAVSRFFYNIPISGYYAIYTDAVGEIVDSVGGVTVRVNEDMTRFSSKWKQGAEVLLTGKNALKYLRHRSGSNEPRLERQKIFLQQFLSEAKQATAQDLTMPVKLYQQLISKTVTNLDAASVAYLASEAVNADFKVIALKGEIGSEGPFETFTVDQDDLYQTLTDVFYKKNN